MTAKIALVLLVLPLIMLVNTGCNDEWFPEDQWPLITHWEHSENLTVNVDLIKPYGIPQLKIPNRQIDMIIDVRSFHAEQPYNVWIFLQHVEQDITFYSNNLPAYSTKNLLGITETHYEERIYPSYVIDSGTPPQGIGQMELFFTPEYFPLTLSEWIGFSINPDTGATLIDYVVDRYVYEFRVVVEDQDGRSDTFEFDVISELKIDDSNDN